MRHEAGPDEHGRSGDNLPIEELDAGEPIVLDDEPPDLTVHDPNTARLELRLLGVGDLVGVDEEGDVVGPLPHELGVLDRGRVCAEHADRLVADFPAVAVRAMQQVSPPALANAGDVGQIVTEPGRDHDPPGR